MTLKYGDYEIDESRFPQPVTNRLLTRAVAHILGNEVAAGVGSKIKRAIAGDKGDVTKVTVDAMAAYREDHPDQVTAWEDEARQAKIMAMYDGTLSVRQSAGPTRDPVESAMRAIAKAEVTQVLKSQGAKFPTGEDTVTIPSADGDVQLTGDDLIARRMAHEKHADRIRKAAERQVAEAKRLREQSAKTAAAETVADL